MSNQSTFDFGNGLTAKAETEFMGGRQAKAVGMKLAATNRAGDLKTARAIARQIARDGDGTCDANQVGLELERLGIDQLGPAAGSLFKGRYWKFTGRRVTARKVADHANELKVWRYMEG